MENSQARQQFYHAIHRPDEAIDLATAALYIAQEEYADLDPAEYLNALDVMAKEVAARLPTPRYPLRVIQTINEYLFDDLGFAGNSQDYYDPRNSYLNQVIDRRTGIPITLSLVYLEIARRVDFPMVGVGMPGHFLIRPLVNEMSVCVDAFGRGEILFPEDCQTRLNQIYGTSVEMQPAFFDEVTSRQVLARMLTNLKLIYLNQSDLDRVLAVVERLLLLYPDAITEQRDRGLLRYQLGHLSSAIQDLQAYLFHNAQAQDAAQIQQILQQIQTTLDNAR
ncbi:SirB1 family protein [Leptolyngbya sp. AN02str]|uniref:SirB1 family protein n=1 Tax=Leptolyngbya sp. AN02str TaxID=3423363 RepID=UPI003D314F99